MKQGEPGKWKPAIPERRVTIGWRWLKHALGLDGQFERRKTVTQ